MWYKVNFDKLKLLVLPSMLRKSFIGVLVSLAYDELKKIHEQWLLNKEQRDIKLSHHGQVCYLRKVLNDEFDNVLRRIQIADGNRFIRTYLYSRAEQKPVFLGKLHLHSKTNYADTGVDFIVYVPSEILDTKELRIKARVDYYKQDVKRYEIVGI